MADTERSQADLLASLFRDGQAAGSILAQQIRDLIVSLTPAIGAIYFSTPVETVISTQGEKTLALGTTLATASLHNIDMPQNNRIRYTGTIPRHFVIDAAISATIVGNNKTVHFQLFKNGSPLVETLMNRAFGTGSDAGAIPLTTNVDMEKDDYIELFVSNETDTANITIVSGTINLTGVLIE